MTLLNNSLPFTSHMYKLVHIDTKHANVQFDQYVSILVCQYDIYNTMLDIQHKTRKSEAEEDEEKQNI